LPWFKHRSLVSIAAIGPHQPADRHATSFIHHIQAAFNKTLLMEGLIAFQKHLNQANTFRGVGIIIHLRLLFLQKKPDFSSLYEKSYVRTSLSFEIIFRIMPKTMLHQAIAYNSTGVSLYV
jgi:hypothetical protein